MEIIIGRQGNQKIKIQDGTVSRHHCKLTEQPNGSYLLENLSQNGTFVDGQSVIKTHVTRDTIIQLGVTYKAKVSDLVGKESCSMEQKSCGSEGLGQNEIPTYSIKPMQYVWDEYQQTLDEIKKKQKSIQNLRMIAPLFAMGSGALSVFKPGAGIPLLIIGIALTLYAYIRGNNDDSDELRKKATDKFQENYLCPNPACRHTHIQAPKLLLLNKTCPYCKCRFVE